MPLRAISHLLHIFRKQLRKYVLTGLIQANRQHVQNKVKNVIVSFSHSTLLIAKLDGKNVAKGFLQTKVGGSDVCCRSERRRNSAKNPPLISSLRRDQKLVKVLWIVQSVLSQAQRELPFSPTPLIASLPFSATTPPSFATSSTSRSTQKDD